METLRRDLNAAQGDVQLPPEVDAGSTPAAKGAAGAPAAATVAIPAR